MNPVAEVFSRAERQPDQVAIVGRDHRVTLGGMTDTVRRAAAWMLRSGVRAGDVVGVAVRPQLEPLFLLAGMQIGVTTFSANARSVALAGDRVRHVVSDEHSRARNTRVIDTDFFAELGGFAPHDDVAPFRSDDMVRIVFSSGTTGAAKGVPFTLETIQHRLASARTSWFQPHPLHCTLGVDSISGFMALLASLVDGHSYITPGPAHERHDLLRSHGVRVLYCSAAQLADLLDAMEEHGAPPLPSLERIDVTGSLMSGALRARAQRLLGLVPSVLYGSTEIGPVARGVADEADPLRVGFVEPGVELSIVDADGAEVPLGSAGLLRARRSGMPAGYWPPLTSESGVGFVDGWFIPGDEASLQSDGTLRIEGRTNDRVNLDGVKLNLAQVDVWLTGLSFASDAASFSYLDERGQARLAVAFASPQPVDSARAEREAQRAAKGVPVSLCVRVPSIPRNELGKVQRAALADFVRERLPGVIGSTR